MRTLASTQIQFGGFILNSDDNAAIVQHLTRLIAYSADVMAHLSEVCNLLFILIPLMIELCHRVLAVMQAIEDGWQLVMSVPETFTPRLGYAPG